MKTRFSDVYCHVAEDAWAYTASLLVIHPTSSELTLNAILFV